MAGRDKKEGKLKGSVGKNIKQEQKMVGDNKTQEIKRGKSRKRSDGKGEGWRERRREEDRLLITFLPSPLPADALLLPSSPPAHSLILPLTVKLFRATSAACLIKFSFLQITIRKRATLLNHITTTSYKTVYLLLGGESGRYAKRNKGSINDCVIP